MRAGEFPSRGEEVFQQQREDRSEREDGGMGASNKVQARVKPNETREMELKERKVEVSRSNEGRAKQCQE